MTTWSCKVNKEKLLREQDSHGAWRDSGTCVSKHLGGCHVQGKVLR